MPATSANVVPVNDHTRMRPSPPAVATILPSSVMANAAKTLSCERILAIWLKSATFQAFTYPSAPALTMALLSRVHASPVMASSCPPRSLPGNRRHAKPV